MLSASLTVIFDPIPIELIRKLIAILWSWNESIWIDSFLEISLPKIIKPSSCSIALIPRFINPDTIALILSDSFFLSSFASLIYLTPSAKAARTEIIGISSIILGMMLPPNLIAFSSLDSTITVPLSSPLISNWSVISIFAFQFWQPQIKNEDYERSYQIYWARK